MTAPIRLRQICLITDQLEPVLDQLIAVFGLQVCYGKADLTRYGVPPREIPPFQKAFFEGLGLASAILPVGETFLELVAPTKPGTAGARYLERKGPGGYMVITEVADLAGYEARIDAEGTRLAGTVDYPMYRELQLDPRDIGAAILSFSLQLEGEPMDGGWYPAGPDWQSKTTPGFGGIVSAELAVADPVATAQRWSRAIGRPAVETKDGVTIELDGAQIRFVEGPEGRLVAIGIEADDFAAARSRAREMGLPVGEDGAIRLSGIDIREAARRQDSEGDGR